MPVPRLLAAVALVAAIALAGCSSSGDDGATDVSTAGASTTVAPAATVTTLVTTTTTAAQTLPPGQPPTTPTDPTAQQAGQRVMDAWVLGDINATAAIVGSDVANAIFSYPAPQEVQSLPCRGSETVYGATECDFQDTTGTITLLIEGNAHNGYRVTNVGFVAAEDLTTATSAP